MPSENEILLRPYCGPKLAIQKHGCQKHRAEWKV